MRHVDLKHANLFAQDVFRLRHLPIVEAWAYLWALPLQGFSGTRAEHKQPAGLGTSNMFMEENPWILWGFC